MFKKKRIKPHEICKLRTDGTVKTDEEFWNEIENAYVRGYLNTCYGMYGEKHLTNEQIAELIEKWKNGNIGERRETMGSSITIEMPFNWCCLCRAIDLESEKMFIFDSSKYERHKCKNEHLCMTIFEAQEEWKKKIGELNV